ncbi:MULTISPECIES: hypothetical protein [Myroides]|uniref:Uncharacterized protein n=2 Tax=Myroides TaxID=76831 RepID=A0A7K1GPH7_9FLAO|nr:MULTISPECIES: hypothetical protein [Myroides]ALU27394.1 hypothetical protein AS202_15050 [Myroides odoratimimus]MBB1151348.1 hypothetical protein [Myroides sp. NP-2]MDM1039596.1 hypothetical protein [Myroides odoratimimus]MDM1053797.1 hypothetical protein [Myroides odoratimimus]MDM1086613.1 hypothetical protein [Myroides odoratimimus]
MNNNFSFINVEFRNKLQNINTKIKEYLTNHNYVLPKNIEIEDLVEWNNFGETTKIYASYNCPDEIKGIITEFIKKEFPI